MPELPEVETVKRVLEQKLIGLQIEEIRVFHDNIIVGDTKNFIRKLQGKHFKEIRRMGKYLIFILEDISFISHLRMEGKYFYKNKDEEVVKHEHVIFYLSNGMTLRYHDVRKFGKMELKKNNEIYDTPPLSHLGYEPFAKEMTADLLLRKINKNIEIKTLLLDQTIIAGLGNIYVDEVLFASGIHPNKKGLDIQLKEASSIINNSRNILKLAMESGGTTIRSYTSSLGVYGHYQDFLKVHTKVGEKCGFCGSTIQKCKINGRSTYFCPNCQNNQK